MNTTYEDSHIKEMATWIKSLSWKENDDRTDALLEVKISTPIDGTIESYESQDGMKSWTKSDFIEFVHALCQERVDSHVIDTLLITMDGDTEDTIVYIKADIHLAK